MIRNGKIALLAIAVVAVGTFALPNTMSLFSGQHTWYQLGSGNKLPCKKCHADVMDELSSSGIHADLNSTGSTENGDCYACHRANKSITYATASNKQPGTKAHAASTVACMLCHQYNASQAVHANAGPFAGGFVNPGSNYNYTNATSEGGYAAHQNFINRSVDSALGTEDMEDANEACIACHTHVPVEINWTHRYSLEFNASYGKELPPTHFNVSNMHANGTYNTTVHNGTVT